MTGFVRGTEEAGKPRDSQVRLLLGKAIRVRREKAGLGPQEAAERLGVSRSTLARWERGEGSLWTGGDAGSTDLEMMGRLRECYACAFSELMPRNQYPSAPHDPAARRRFFWQRNHLIGARRADTDGALIAGEAMSGEELDGRECGFQDSHAQPKGGKDAARA